MVLVILCHIGGLPSEYAYKMMFSLNLPVFLILAGYFFRIKENKEVFASGVRRLVVPYIVTSLVWLSYYLVVGVKHGEFYTFAQMALAALYANGAPHSSHFLSGIPPTGAVWFLLALFWCRIFYNIIAQRFTGLTRYGIAVAVSVVATMLDRYVVNLPFDILPGMSVLTYYAIGNMLREQQGRISLYRTPLAIAGAVVWVYAIARSHNFIVVCDYGCYPVDFAAGCFGTYLTYLVAEFILRKCRMLGTALEWIGLNSLTILCLHFLELHTPFWYFLRIPFNWYVLFPAKICFVSAGVFLLPRVRRILSSVLHL